MHPTGKFEAEVTATSVVRTSKNNKLSVQVGLKTEHGGIVAYLSLEGGAKKYTMEKLANIGWEGETFRSLNQEGRYTGNKCYITVEEEEYDGVWRPRVKYIDRLGGVQEADDDAARDADRIVLGLDDDRPIHEKIQADDLPF